MAKEKRKLNSVYANPSQKTGRPSTYREEYCQKVLNFLAEGGFFYNFNKEIGVNVSTVYEWLDVHPAFSLAKEKGEKIRNAGWFSVQAVENLGNKDFNVGLFCLLARNTNGWRTTDPREKEETAAPVVNVFVNKKAKKDKDDGN